MNDKATAKAIKGWMDGGKFNGYADEEVNEVRCGRKNLSSKNIPVTITEGHDLPAIDTEGLRNALEHKADCVEKYGLPIDRVHLDDIRKILSDFWPAKNADEGEGEG